MKTIFTLILAAFCLTATSVQAQSWRPGDAPHKHSAYFRGRPIAGHPGGHSYGRPGSRHDFGFTPYRYHDCYCPVTFEAGLVTKRYATYFGPADRFHENLWGEQGRFMSGMQMGLAFQPTAYNGVGFRTGAYYEFYVASGAGVRELGYNRFTEHDLYFPIHFAYNFSVAPGVDIDLNTGLGFNVALAGVYRSWGRNGGVDWQEYGNYDRPDRINAMWEFGASVRYDHFKFGLNYGLGLNDHEFYDNARTRQNKLSVTAGITF